jgi:flagellum-specific ATP synthase
MSGRLVQSVKAATAGLDLSQVGARRIGRLVAHEGAMLEAEGFSHPLGTAVRIPGTGGSELRGEVVGFHGNRSLILPFNSDAPVGAGSRVEPDGHGGLAQCGNALLGRVIDAHGLPLDGRGPISSRLAWPLAGQRVNPLRRSRITRPLDVGVRAINALLTVGIGQRVAIIAGSGVGKSVLMGQMLAPRGQRFRRDEDHSRRAPAFGGRRGSR